MITCPWCGTSYATFQSDCAKCGGSLPLPPEQPSVGDVETVSIPPQAPRHVPGHTVWRILSSDGWAITGGVFLLLGLVFGLVGTGLAIAVITAFVGLPFIGLSMLMLAGGAILATWRYRKAQQTVEVLREGKAVQGELVDVHQNLYVRVNGRHPWTITYRYAVNGGRYEGKVVTLMRPDLAQRPGAAVYVLYKPTEPAVSTIYPHPYGYHSV